MSISGSSSSSSSSGGGGGGGGGGGVAPNLVTVFQDYVYRMINVSGMKALVLDEETTTMMATVLGQSDLIQKEVFLIQSLRVATQQTLKQGQESTQHLKAIVFVRPTAESLRMLKALLTMHKFKDFYIYFSSVAGDQALRDLAEADQFELIRQVHEFYADYYVLTDNVFSMHVQTGRALTRSEAYWGKEEKLALERQSEGLLALFASLKRRPDIRFTASSELTKSLALDLGKRMRQEQDILNWPGEPPLLLILDRRDDPVTPLLMQWTYQAMVHEIFGIRDNRVDLSHIPGVDPAQKEVVLASHLDSFYKKSMFLNYGDFCLSVQSLVQEYQRKTKSTVKLDTIEDMQQFVDKFPEFRAFSGNVTKHVTVISQLRAEVAKRKLLAVSELEQELACNQDHAKAVREIFPLIENPAVAYRDKVCLVALYALRYERDNNQLGQLRALLRSKAQSTEEILASNFVDEILAYAGAARRGGDLFGNKNILSKVSSWARSGLRDVENVYTQHKPLLADTLNSLATGKFKANLFPTLESVTGASPSKVANLKYRLVVVYMVGGLTYEETAAIDAFNASNQAGMKVISGGSTVHNANTFIADVVKGGASSSNSSSSNGAGEHASS